MSVLLAFVYYCLNTCLFSSVNSEIRNRPDISSPFNRPDEELIFLDVFVKEFKSYLKNDAYRLKADRHPMV